MPASLVAATNSIRSFAHVIVHATNTYVKPVLTEKGQTDVKIVLYFH